MAAADGMLSVTEGTKVSREVINDVLVAKT